MATLQAVFVKRSRSPWRRWLAGVAVVVLLLIGVWFGGHPSWLPPPLRSAFVSKTANERLVQTTLDLISKDYYKPVNTSKLLNSGLEAAVNSLDDPYSHYYPPALYHSFQNETNPQVAGIGVQVAAEPVDNGIEVEEVFQGSPAAKAGLQHGDIITAVGTTSLSGKTVDQGSKLIRGKAGSSVQLTVTRAGKKRTVTITRADVTVPVASSKLLHYKSKALGYLQFTQFTEGSAAQLRVQVQAMLKAGAQGLILDLRDNPGGLLEQAVGVASLFIKNGTIVSTRGRNQPTTVYTALGDAIAPTIPMVVLVDRGTASSAEIVTGALKDRGRAKIVGTNTYGKGVFQELMPLSGGAALDITVGEYYTPNGHNLGGGGVKEGKGIKPNVYVYDNPDMPGTHALKVAEQTVAGEIK
ncbi:MAG TPA: S41 family peptidase [Solirubrobacteraceae bacterium]|jgi:carboxyl-terminal processing protease|nr:S41 family peptidase [Solirubrobacteraceae bacterium]